MKKSQLLFSMMIILLIVTALLFGCNPIDTKNNERNENGTVVDEENGLEKPTFSSYIVRFDLQGGEGNIDDIHVNEGGTITLPTEPTRTGYLFSGWYLEQSYETEFLSTTPVNGGITLYAKWTEKPNTAGLTFSLSDDQTYYTVTEYTGTATEVNIASTYNGLPVKSIGNSAFIVCSNLTSITIPTSVTSIEYGAFAECIGLTSITIPASVTSIGDGAFDGCNGLTSITVSSGNAKYHSNGNCLIDTLNKALVVGCKTSVIPTDGSVTSIGYSAFYRCSGLTSITIPASVTSIGDGAFDGCNGLTSITVSSGNAKYHSNGNCLIDTLNKALVVGCKTSVMPTDGSVTSIGDSAFYGCSGLTSLTIPAGVTSIGDSAFYGCSGLTSLTIPAGVTSIGDGAFRGCSSLESITIPVGVTSIGYSAFSGCSGLTSITFADTSTWYSTQDYSGWQNKTGGTPVDVTSPSGNVDKFTKTYAGYYWYKL